MSKMCDFCDDDPKPEWLSPKAWLGGQEAVRVMMNLLLDKLALDHLSPPKSA